MQKIVWGVGIYSVILTVSLVGGCFCWIQVVRGKLIITDRTKLFEAIKKGRLLIVANHPTLLETVILQLLMFPRKLVHPRRYFIWCVPSASLFRSWWGRWLYKSARCVEINRNDKCSRRRALRSISAKLKSGETVLVHGEAGRTNGKLADSPLINLNGRYMREMLFPAARIARIAEADVLPVWFEIPFWENKNDFKQALWYWIRSGEVITIHIGDVLKSTDNLTQENIQTAIMDA